MRFALALALVVASVALAQNAGQASTRGADRCYDKNCRAKTLQTTTATGANNVGLFLTNTASTYGGSFCLTNNNGTFPSYLVQQNGTQFRIYGCTSALCAAGCGAQMVTVDANASNVTVPSLYTTSMLGTASRWGSSYDFSNPGALGAGGLSYNQLEWESGTKHLWWFLYGNNQAIDLQSGAHPVLDRRTFALSVGFESASTPTCEPACPRSGGSTLTVSVVDAAAAAGSSAGSAPAKYDFRQSNTAAAAGSTSTVTLSGAFADVARAPRWCQRVRTGAAVTSVRYWVGMAQSLPGSSDAPATHHASFRFSTDAADTKWAYCYGAGATTCAPTTVTVNASQTYLLCVDCREGSACSWWIDGVHRARVTSGLPTNVMSPFWSVEARAASARELLASTASVEVN